MFLNFTWEEKKLQCNSTKYFKGKKKSKKWIFEKRRHNFITAKGCNSYIGFLFFHFRLKKYFIKSKHNKKKKQFPHKLFRQNKFGNLMQQKKEKIDQKYKLQLASDGTQSYAIARQSLLCCFSRNSNFANAIAIAVSFGFFRKKRTKEKLLFFYEKVRKEKTATLMLLLVWSIQKTASRCCCANNKAIAQLWWHIYFWFIKVWIIIIIIFDSFDRFWLSK